MFRDVEIRMRTTQLFARRLPEPSPKALHAANQAAMNVQVRSGCVVVEENGERDLFAVMLPGGMYAQFTYDDDKQSVKVQIDE